MDCIPFDVYSISNMYRLCTILGTLYPPPSSSFSLSPHVLLLLLHALHTVTYVSARNRISFIFHLSACGLKLSLQYGATVCSSKSLLGPHSDYITYLVIIDQIKCLYSTNELTAGVRTLNLASADFRLQRSHTRIRLLSIVSAMSPSTPGLAHFLVESKASYLNAVEDGRSKEWTVVMGNEAGGKPELSQAYARC